LPPTGETSPPTGGARKRNAGQDIRSVVGFEASLEDIFDLGSL